MPSPTPWLERGGGFRRGGTILACQQVMHSLKKGCIEALMGLFRDNTTLELLQDRIAKQELIADDLAREVRGLKLEYIELYDKVRHQMSRMAKRTAVDNRERLVDEVIEEEADGVDPISRNILALRGTPRTAA